MDMPITNNRFLAYFDIMGFKDLIYRNDHAKVEGIIDKMTECVEAINSVADEHINNGNPEMAVKPAMFSDSVIFVSQSDDIVDACYTIFVASCFMWSMFDNEIPIKGALAYGRFTADFEKSKFFGRPLVDAYLLAEEVHFYGAVLHHTIENFLHGKTHKSLDLIQPHLKKKPVPMKGGNIAHLFVDWTHHVGTTDDKSAETMMDGFYRTVSGSTRKYVDNTLAVYSKKSV